MGSDLRNDANISPSRSDLEYIVEGNTVTPAPFALELVNDTCRIDQSAILIELECVAIDFDRWVQ